MIKLKQPGFTLIEMLLAVALFAIVGLGSANVLSSVANSNEVSIEHSQRMEQLQRTMLTFERDLRQASRRKARANGQVPSKYFVAHGEGMLDSQSQVLALRKVGWINPMNLLPRSEVQSFGYRIMEGNLERIHYDFPDPAMGTEFKTRVLLTGIKAIKFEFHDGKAQSNNKMKWLTLWSQTDLPAAIAVTLTLDDMGEITRLFLLPMEQS